MQHPYHQRTSMAAPPRYLQTVAPPGQHIRRQPLARPVHLETLLERDAEEGNGRGLVGVVGGKQSAVTPQTATSNSYSDSSTHQQRPGYPQYTRPHSRRLSSYPLRSSPLAGPSVMLTQDGTLTNVNAAQRPRSLLSVCESAFNSPVPSANPSLENLSTKVTTAANKENQPTHPPSPPAKAKQSPSKRLSLGLKRLASLPSLPKRISLSIPSPPEHSYSAKGKSKEKSMAAAGEAAASTPGIPKIPVWAAGAARTASRAPLPFRPHSPSHAHPNSEPLNRRASMGSLVPSVVSVQSNKSAHRRSLAVSAHPVPSTSRDPELNWLSTAAPPKFSRLSLKADGVVMPISAKEMRRRSTASLSRASSVRSVQSVTSVNSTLSVMSRISENGPSSDRRTVTFDTSTLRKLEGDQPSASRSPSAANTSSPPVPSRPTTPIMFPALSSVSEEEDDSDPVSPPLPPFFNPSKNGSASSITSSSAGTASCEESDILETPSLSRTSSVTEDEEVGLPQTPPGTITNTGSVGVVSEATKDLHIRAVQPVVKTPEAVTVEVVGVQGPPGHGRGEGSSGEKSSSSVGGDGKVGRKATLRKVLGRVFGGRSASMPAIKVRA